MLKHALALKHANHTFTLRHTNDFKNGGMTWLISWSDSITPYHSTPHHTAYNTTLQHAIPHRTTYYTTPTPHITPRPHQILPCHAPTRINTDICERAIGVPSSSSQHTPHNTTAYHTTLACRDTYLSININRPDHTLCASVLVYASVPSCAFLGFSSYTIALLKSCVSGLECR